MLSTRMMMAAAGVEAGGGGAFDDWSHYVEVTVQSSQVASNLTDFPVFVDLSTLPSGFFTNAKSDGSDIRVTESDGETELPREVVAIDTGAETGELHFLASSLSSSADTVFRIYVGNAAASEPAVTDPNGRNAVWAGYLAVYHMQEDPSTDGIKDSSGNVADGTPEGSMTSGDSVAGHLSGNALDFDGSDDRIRVTSVLGGVTEFTLSVSINPDNVSADGDIYTRGTHGANEPFVSWLDTNGTIEVLATDSGGTYTGVKESATSPALDEWTRLAISFKGGANIRMFFAGSEDANSPFAISATDIDTGGFEEHIGNDDDASGGHPKTFDGTIDELRIASSELSADFLAAENVNLDTPATFYSVGSLTAN